MLEYLRQCKEGVLDGRTPYPDLILLDLNMPRMDGRRALQEARLICSGSRTPIIVFSTSDDVADIKTCYDAGCNTYVTKPSELDDFKAALNLIAAYWLELATLP